MGAEFTSDELRELGLPTYADLNHKLTAALSELDAKDAEIGALRARRLPCREAEVAQARYEAAEAEIERLRQALQDIKEWCDGSYEPCWLAARRADEALAPGREP